MLMQTLKACVRGPNDVYCARALIDSPSETSYILSSLANQIDCVGPIWSSRKYPPFSLWGYSTEFIWHNEYLLHVPSVDDKFNGCKV